MSRNVTLVSRRELCRDAIVLVDDQHYQVTRSGASTWSGENGHRTECTIREVAAPAPGAYVIAATVRPNPLGSATPGRVWTLGR